MTSTPVSYGSQAVLDSAVSDEHHYCFVGDSQNEPLSYNATVNQQGMRIRYGVFRNWNKSWVGLTHPGAAGSFSNGSSMLLAATSHTRTTGIKPGTATDAAFDGKLCNDAAYWTFGADVATDEGIDLGGATSSGNHTGLWLSNVSPASDLYLSGSLWFNGVTMRARVLYANSTTPATLRCASRRAGTVVNSADFVHPETGNTLRSQEVTVQDSGGGGDIRLAITGGTGSENGKTFCCSGFMVYRYDAAVSGTLKIAAGSTINSVAHSGWTLQNHIDRITEQSLYEWYLETFPPTCIFIMLGHNASAAELTDLDGANNGLVLGNLVTLAQRHISAASRAAVALGTGRLPRVIFVVPWLASAAGGLDTVARGVAWRNRMVSAANTVGGSCVSLFDLFAQGNPLMNPSHLHPDAANSSANTDIKTITRGLLAAMSVPVQTRRRLRNR